jgi:hypothetical protein
MFKFSDSVDLDWKINRIVKYSISREIFIIIKIEEIKGVKMINQRIEKRY